MAKQEEKKPAKIRVRVLRAFYYGNERRNVGEELDMSEIDYLQWKMGHKVEMVKPQDPPPTTDEKKAPEDSAFQQGGGFNEPKRKKEGK